MIPGSANPLLLKSAAAAGGYQVSRSLRFNSSDSAYCSRTPAVAGNRKTWTWAGWVKRSGLGAGFGPLFATPTGVDDTTLFNLLFYDDTIYIAGSATGWRRTSAVFRDSSAWYHILASVDTNQTTANNRIRLYVNGTEVTAFSTLNNPSQGASLGINNTSLHTIGNYSTNYFSGYLADIHFIDGQALTPSSFTEVSATTGQLIPKAYAGSYTGNSFHLDFADNSALTSGSNVGIGKDTSGLGNYWNTSGLSVTAGAGNDSLVDTPTSYGTDTGVGGEVRGNYATWNPLALGAAGSITNGNLDLVITPASTAEGRLGNFYLPSGKWYWEMTVTVVSAEYPHVGLTPRNNLVGGNIDSDGSGYCIRMSGRIDALGSTNQVYGTSYTTGDIVMFAYDVDAGKLWYGKNGTWQVSGNPASGTNPSSSSISTVIPYTFAASGFGSPAAVFNGGQRAFAYTAPSGFKALCDTNLGAPLVAKPNTLMDVALYTGTGAALTPTSSLGFNPDWIWIKSRSAATDHALYDVVRGAQARLESNTTDAEVTTDGGVTAFNSAGFTLGTLAQVNTSSATYAAWCWDAGTSTVSNTAGSITSQVRANVSAGFSVVTYTGTGANATVGHGGLVNLSSGMIIVKSRTSSARQWPIYHAGNKGTGNNLNPQSSYIYLNLTNSAPSSGYSGFWNDTAPTSTVFSVGTDGGTNASGENFVAYCFAPVVGYSSFGSYTGNGSADGPFVYTGFRPKWLMIKVTNISGESWVMKDAVRNTYNPVEANFYADLSAAEQTSNNTRYIDFTSNGFKLRGTEVSVNGSANTYVYMCFAENPFQYARAR